MNTYSFLEITEKDVINLCTGENLGSICDIEIDIKDCCVKSIVIPGQGGIWGLGKATEMIIPWCKIECIGEDAVLVRLSADEQSSCTVPKRKLKRHMFGK